MSNATKKTLQEVVEIMREAGWTGEKTYSNIGNNHGIIGDGNQQTITNSFNTGTHGTELAKLLEALRTAFEAEKQSLSPHELKTVERCLTAIEEEANEEEPSGAVIKAMSEKLVKGIATSAQAVGLVKAATKRWDFCQQWSTGG
jgi:hypothetical protein